MMGERRAEATMVSHHPAAWRCGGFLAQKFNSITNVEPCINV